MLLPFLLALCPPADAVTARWAAVDAWDNVNGGEWYRGYDNEEATLAWGESYVMMALTALFRATGDPIWLDRLASHADAVLAQRDDARGVADYRGVSGACWRDLHYQDDGTPYCYVVHSGMIAYPIAEFARLVRDRGLEAEVAYDGETFGARAERYTRAVAETVAFHDREWNAAGYYMFPSDADFLPYAGEDVPLNQSNAMGRVLLVLADLMGDAATLGKARALADRFEDQVTVGSDGAALWNYWGGDYAAYGEDISHAAINVDFAVLAASYGVVFDRDDLDAFATTFVERVYVDDQTFSDAVGGGSTNDPSYLAQVGRWLRLTPTRTAVYTSVRDLYEASFPAATVASGSTFLAWAYLAEFEPVLCPHFFYHVDWTDPVGGWREATAYGANVLTVPPDLSGPCMIPLTVDVPRTDTVQQWDGGVYHDVARWQATSGEVLRRIPYEPRWPHVYWSDGVLFQFSDAFAAGDGIRVAEPTPLVAPSFTNTPSPLARVGEPWTWDAEATGDAPFWWSLERFPAGARVDNATGLVTWTPTSAGDHPFTVRVANDAGSADYLFTLVASGAEGDDTAPPETGDPPDTGAPAKDGADGCGCAAPASGGASGGGGSLAALAGLVVASYGSRRRRTQAPGQRGSACRTPSSMSTRAPVSSRTQRATRSSSEP